jgi:beta-lactamase regulating signal transducer with metallopeptidase domain
MFLFDKIGLALFHFTWQAAVTALLTSLILFLFKKAGSRVHYILCCFSIILMIASPIYTALNSPEKSFQTIIHLNVNELSPVNAKEIKHNGSVYAIQYRRNEIPLSFYEKLLAGIRKYTPQISLLWIVGVILMSFYHLYGFVKLRGFTDNTNILIEPGWKERIQKLIQHTGIKQKIKVIPSAKISAPAVIGFIKPVILIPVSVFTGIEGKYIEAIVLHELAHIKRYDYFFNIIQIIIETLGFFHPAVWWISNRIRKERENCCDDFAVKITGDKLVYVKSLVKLEEMRQDSSFMMAANGGNLLDRVSRILNSHSGKSSSDIINPVIPFIVTIILIVSFGFTYANLGGYGISKNFFRDKESLVNNLNRNMVAYFPFNGNANDESSYKQKTSVHNAVLCEDRFGIAKRAFDFNGKNSFIETGSLNVLNKSKSLSISCWVYTRKISDYEPWVSKAGSKWYSQWRFGFVENKEREWGLTQANAVGGNPFWRDYVVSPAKLPLNRWVHVAVTADQEKHLISLYINGKRICLFEDLIPFEESESPVFIGYQRDDNVYFNGKMDNVRIYNCVLSDDEIEALSEM